MYLPNDLDKSIFLGKNIKPSIDHFIIIMLPHLDGLFRKHFKTFVLLHLGHNSPLDLINKSNLLTINKSSETAGR